MKKLFLGFLAVVMLWGVNVSASEEEGVIDLEVKNKTLSEVVSIVSDINVKENVQGVRYEITNDKAVLFVALEDSNKYDETKKDVVAIEGVEVLDEAAPTITDEPVVDTKQPEITCKCDTISDKDINSIVTANYILYATEIILLALIVIIVILITRKDKKKK
ncbi:MAG: hypothetical protein J6X02_01000 [Bacilli bacterium]|nr:hypothetical protein [Bacilli bacterium]